MTDKLYTQAELDTLLKAAEAAALRAGYEKFQDEYCKRGSPLAGVMHGLRGIESLMTPAASLALERLIAKERLEEAEWWAENRMHMILPYVPEKVGPRGANRIAELRRAADVAGKEKSNE